MRVNCTVNGAPMAADDVWEGESLLYLLRERLALPGSKNACEQGECGSCTVYLDGVPVCACLVAAGQADGREIATVEGLAGRDLGQSLGQVARLTCKNQRRKGRELLLDVDKCRRIGIVRHLQDRLAAPAVWRPSFGHGFTL